MTLLRKPQHDLEQEFATPFGELFHSKVIDDLDWSRQYINKQVPRLVGMFKWAVGKEICSPTVVMALKQLPGLKKGRSRARETAGVTFVEDAIVEATLPHVPELIADMIRLQRLTGARPGEICSLRPGDIDRSEKVWLYIPREHKTEHHNKSLSQNSRRAERGPGEGEMQHGKIIVGLLFPSDK